MFKKFFAKILLPIFIFLISFTFTFAVELKEYIDPINVSGDDGNIALTVVKVLNQIFGIIGILALAIFVFSGVKYIASFGKAEEAKKALEYMRWAVVGLLIIFLSYAFIRFVFEQIFKIGS